MQFFFCFFFDIFIYLSDREGVQNTRKNTPRRLVSNRPIGAVKLTAKAGVQVVSERRIKRTHVMVCLTMQRCSFAPRRQDTGPARPRPSWQSLRDRCPAPAFQEASHPFFCALTRSSSTFRCSLSIFCARNGGRGPLPREPYPVLTLLRLKRIR